VKEGRKKASEEREEEMEGGRSQASSTQSSKQRTYDLPCLELGVVSRQTLKRWGKATLA
jgi:hypothetical protein